MAIRILRIESDPEHRRTRLFRIGSLTSVRFAGYRKQNEFSHRFLRRIPRTGYRTYSVSERRHPKRLSAMALACLGSLRGQGGNTLSTGLGQEVQSILVLIPARLQHVEVPPVECRVMDPRPLESRRRSETGPAVRTTPANVTIVSPPAESPRRSHAVAAAYANPSSSASSRRKAAGYGDASSRANGCARAERSGRGRKSAPAQCVCVISVEHPSSVVGAGLLLIAKRGNRSRKMDFDGLQPVGKILRPSIQCWPSNSNNTRSNAVRLEASPQATTGDWRSTRVTPPAPRW